MIIKPFHEALKHLMLVQITGYSMASRFLPVAATYPFGCKASPVPFALFFYHLIWSARSFPFCFIYTNININLDSILTQPRTHTSIRLVQPPTQPIHPGPSKHPIIYHFTF